MTGEGATRLVVGLKSREEQLSQVIEILRQIEVRAEVVNGDADDEALARVTLRIPHERVVAAVLALERHGFTRLKAYARKRPE